MPRTCSRRQFLIAAGVFGTISHMQASTQTAAKTFVLIHGAWHGGWCWRKLTPLLQAGGHIVYTPTLTGLGERGHLLTREVGLSTHIEDVAAVLEFEDMHNAILVGHSYAGMVISGLSRDALKRVGQLVYIDAFLPADGDAVTKYMTAPPVREDGWRMPVPGKPPRFGVKDAQDVSWMEARLTDQPLKTFTQTVAVDEAVLATKRRTFIQCSKSPIVADAAMRARQMRIPV
jgi:pimeloyl-ACP methyl ester carboxylesterase